MPLLAALVRGLFGNAYAFAMALFAGRVSLRISAVAIFGASYVACLVLFSAFIEPLVSAAFSTSFGQVLGLFFPPIAGTVLAGIAALWLALLAKNYTRKLGGVLVQ